MIQVVKIVHVLQQVQFQALNWSPTPQAESLVLSERILLERMNFSQFDYNSQVNCSGRYMMTQARNVSLRFLAIGHPDSVAISYCGHVQRLHELG